MLRTKKEQNCWPIFSVVSQSKKAKQSTVMPYRSGGRQTRNSQSKDYSDKRREREMGHLCRLLTYLFCLFLEWPPLHKRGGQSSGELCLFLRAILVHFFISLHVPHVFRSSLSHSVHFLLVFSFLRFYSNWIFSLWTFSQQILVIIAIISSPSYFLISLSRLSLNRLFEIKVSQTVLNSFIVQIIKYRKQKKKVVPFYV